MQNQIFDRRDKNIFWASFSFRERQDYKEEVLSLEMISVCLTVYDDSINALTAHWQIENITSNDPWQFYSLFAEACLSSLWAMAFSPHKEFFK